MTRISKIIEKTASSAGIECKILSKMYGRIGFGRCPIGIDGRSGAGKSTFAALLSKELNAPIVHMDHFFLPPEMRTPERLSQPGGNVYYERFAEEVLPFLREKVAFSYRIYNCGTGEYSETAEIPVSDFVIVEGTYSLYPEIRKSYGLTVFLDVSPEEQARRLTEREGAERYPTFRDKWIPLEEAYFAACHETIVTTSRTNR